MTVTELPLNDAKRHHNYSLFAIHYSLFTNLSKTSPTQGAIYD